MKPNAWHWVSSDRTLRDGRPLPAVGETLRHEGEMRICGSGLHASRDPLSALQYAPGPIICRVRCNGIQQEQIDKLVCRERTVLWCYDATSVLHHFARLCALDVVHLWDAPPVVLRYLRTGNKELREASLEESQEVSWAAIWAANREAISASRASWAASRAASWEASWAASREASWESRAASWAASWAASCEAQSRRLTRMLTEGRPR